LGWAHNLLKPRHNPLSQLIKFNNAKKLAKTAFFAKKSAFFFEKNFFDERENIVKK